jgi:iron complex outermembrane recepter protein
VPLLLIVACAILARLTVAAPAQGDEAPVYQLKIPNEPLNDALQEFARQSGLQIVFLSRLTEGYQAPALSGRFTATAALNKLLTESHLKFRQLNAGTIEVYRPQPDELPATSPAGADSNRTTQSSASRAESASDNTDSEPKRWARPGETPVPANSGQAASATDAATGKTTSHAAPIDLEEIVVTADRRQEKLQDVPIAVTALGTDAIERLRINGIDDLARNVPSLTFSELSPGEVRLSMRGITSQTGLAPVVGYYLDDVAFENRSGVWAGVSNIDYFDLDRIEVLRGPQGSLFGAGAMGGAVRLITAQPDPSQVIVKLEGGASTTAGGDPSYSAKAAYNQPLTDNLALRVVVTQNRSGGFIDGATVTDYANLLASAPIFARNENDSSVTTARAALRWTPNDLLNITPSFLYRHSTADGFDYYQPDPGPEYVRHHDFTDVNHNSLAVSTLDIDQKIGSVTLTSVTSYQRKIWQGVDDYSQAGAQIYQAFTGSPVALALPLLNIYTLDYREFAQELRLTSANAGKLRWVVGARYMHFEDKPGGQTITSTALGAIISPLLGVSPPQSVLIAGSDESDSGGEVAGFGEATYEVIPHLDVTAGLRVYKLMFTNDALFLGGLLGSGLSPAASANTNGTNPKFNTSYHVTDTVLTYVTAAKGYRPGGPNEALLGAVGAPCQYTQAYRSVYDPDSVWNYELGSKSTLLDGAVTLDAAIYRTDWSGIQGNIVSNCGGFIANLGKARIRGAELEATLRPIKSLEFGASGSYNDAKFVSIDAVLAGALAISPGDRVASVPKTQVSVSGEWRMPVSALINGYLRTDAQYVSSAPTSYTNRTAEYTRPSYTTLNAAIGCYIRDLELSVYGQNLANRLQVVDIFQPSGGTPDWIVAPPRTVGLTLRYHFH